MAKLLGRVTEMPSWARPSSSSEFAHRIALTKRQITAQTERQAPTTDPHHYRVSGLVHRRLCGADNYVAAAGVDINTIRAWLGHVSLDTTNIYVEVDLEMKAKALATVDISGTPTASRRSTALPSLMAFLKQL